MTAVMRPVEMDALCNHLARTYGATVVGLGGTERDRLFNFRSRALLAFGLECCAGSATEQADDGGAVRTSQMIAKGVHLHGPHDGSH